MANSNQNLNVSKYVTLISSDGFEFVVLRDAACVSGAIKRMLDPKSNFAEAATGRCTFAEIKYTTLFSFLPSLHSRRSKEKWCSFLVQLLHEIMMGHHTGHDGIILEKVAEYFYYNFKNRNREDVPDMEIPPELCLELLMAADYLDT